MEPPLGFLLKLPPAMIIVPIAVKIAYLIGFLLILATLGVSIAWGVYKVKGDKDKQAKFKKATMGTGISALIIMVMTTLIDFLFVSGLPPSWWPEENSNNEL